jgi:Tfp pilus assembly protein PilV
MARARARALDEAGLSLIEVMITALLVALIVVATLTGFSAAGRATASERFHDQATLIAAESQEALRSDPSSALDTLVTETEGEHKGRVYTVTNSGESFTVTQTAEYINDTEATSCNTGSSTTAARYYEVGSSVTWAQLEKAGLKAVAQTSKITPPDGSGLEVDVTNLATPEAPVEGVTVNAGEATTTTSKAGCAIFGAIPSTSVSVDAHKPGYVGLSGEYELIDEEVAIAPNLTTHHEVHMEKGGAIEAEFVYKKAKALEISKESVPVTYDTFVVSNTSIPVYPKFELGSTKVETFPNGTYNAILTPYEGKAVTPGNAADYPKGNLFPYKTAYAVYAGDCTNNAPPSSVISEESETEHPADSAVVLPEATKVTRVPLSYVNLSVWSGTESSKAGSLETSKAYPVKITNTACKTTVANNATEAVAYHAQETAINPSKGTNPLAGHLEYPFQPFGKFELCVWSSTLTKTYKVSYENTTVTGSTVNIYLGAKTGSGGSITIAEKQKTNTC